MRSVVASRLLLCECHRPFVLPRPATTPTATAKRKLPLPNPMGQLDAGNRDGRIRERLEPGHRRAPTLDGAMVLLDEVVQILVRPNLDVPPARVLSPQQPQRTSTRYVAVERHLAWHTRSDRCKRLTEERLGRSDAAVTSEQEVDGLAMLVD